MSGVIEHFGTDRCLSVPTSAENRPVSLNSTGQTTLPFSDGSESKRVDSIKPRGISLDLNASSVEMRWVNLSGPFGKS